MIKTSRVQKLLKTLGDPLKPNFNGVPKEGLTWEEVFNMKLEPSFSSWPEKCPMCRETMIEYYSDWLNIESTGQYMVRGTYCSNGHFTFLDCA